MPGRRDKQRERAASASADNSQPTARVIPFPTRKISTAQHSARRQQVGLAEKRRIISEKLYEMFMSALDDGPVNRDLVEELYKTFLKRKQG